MWENFKDWIGYDEGDWYIYVIMGSYVAYIFIKNIYFYTEGA